MSSSGKDPSHFLSKSSGSSGRLSGQRQLEMMVHTDFVVSGQPPECKTILRVVVQMQL